MFDLNAIVNAALTAAVAEAIKPLVERITALENNPAQGVDAEMDLRVGVLAQRVTALEERPAVHIDEAKMVEALNSQEWFWEKLRRTTDAQIEQSMDNHLECYNHDEYDSVVSNWNDEDPADFLREGDLCDQIDDRVNETLRNATFSISI
jgi:hypothetical protein